MQTRYLTSLTTTLNPFSRAAKTPRLFLAQLPPTIRSTLKINVKQLPRDSKDPSSLFLTFKDGKEMKFFFENAEPGSQNKTEEMKLRDVIAEVERHSRILGRKEDLAS